jgi:hypothetical protein
VKRTLESSFTQHFSLNCIPKSEFDMLAIRHGDVDEAKLMQANTVQIETYIRLIRANNVMSSPWSTLIPARSLIQWGGQAIQAQAMPPRNASLQPRSPIPVSVFSLSVLVPWMLGTKVNSRDQSRRLEVRLTCFVQCVRCRRSRR